jgi:hypothetical protein
MDHHHRMPNISFTGGSMPPGAVLSAAPETNHVGHPPRYATDPSPRPASLAHDQVPPVASDFAGDNVFPFLSDWHPAHQSCQRYFVNQAQHSPWVQAIAAFVNIRLPFQWHDRPLSHLPDKDRSPASSPAQDATAFGAAAAVASLAGAPQQPPEQQRPPGQPKQGRPFLSLIPYIRRLVVTGNDTDVVLNCFFGSDWARGVGPQVRVERRNYMFLAKSAGWGTVKQHYDGGGQGGGGPGGGGGGVGGSGTRGDEAVPFMAPLNNVLLGEIQSSERAWSDWLAMEDWMLGPRRPLDLRHPISRDEGHDEMLQDQ